MKTYDEAVQNQWSIAYHRMKYAEWAKEHNKNPNCHCDNCSEHFSALKARKEKVKVELNDKVIL